MMVYPRSLHILSLGHEASRSGAAIIHLGWLQWAAVQSERFSVRSITVRGGPLLREWPKAIQNHSLSRIDRGRSVFTDWVGSKVIDRPRFVRHRLKQFLSGLEPGWPDVVLVNTLTLGWLLPCLQKFGCPIVIHAHELAGSTRQFTSSADLRAMWELTSRWIAVSDAVRSHLVRDIGVNTGKIAVVRNFAPPRPALKEVAVNLKAQLAAAYNLPIDAAWIVAVGNLAPVKAPEMFMATAEYCRRTPGTRCVFIWIGDGLSSRYGQTLLRKQKGNDVLFVPQCADPRPWLSSASIVVVTSIEESSSLVAFEAALLGTPVMAFRGTGGIDEFLEGGAGVLVEERSPAAMAAEIKSTLAQSLKLAAMVRMAAAKVAAESNYDTQCEALAAVLEACR